MVLPWRGRAVPSASVKAYRRPCVIGLFAKALGHTDFAQPLSTMIRSDRTLQIGMSPLADDSSAPAAVSACKLAPTTSTHASSAFTCLSVAGVTQEAVAFGVSGTFATWFTNLPFHFASSEMHLRRSARICPFLLQ